MIFFILKKSYEKNAKLLFNLQLLAFINKTKINDLYNKITKKYKDKKYITFFNYFNRTG